MASRGSQALTGERIGEQNPVKCAQRGLFPGLLVPRLEPWTC